MSEDTAPEDTPYPLMTPVDLCLALIKRGWSFAEAGHAVGVMQRSEHVPWGMTATGDPVYEIKGPVLSDVKK